MMPKLYTIRPLKWEDRSHDYRQGWSTETLFGTYYVERNANSSGQWSAWRWRFYRAASRIMEADECDSAAHGKQLAEADWLARITPALEAVEMPCPIVATRKPPQTHEVKYESRPGT